MGPTGFADLAGVTGAGPSGYLQHGNFIDCWGTITATTTGVTGNFAKPYTDNPPIFTLGGVTGVTGGAPYVAGITEQEIFAAANQGRIAGALDRDGNQLTELR
jgi:hypothetical protein